MSFGKALLIAVALLPVAEIATFILVARAIGSLGALALLLLATIAGVLLLRRAGRTRIARLRVALSDGRVDEIEVQSLGFVALLVGILLLVPGFLTDLAGLLLLIPAVRRGLGAAIGRAVLGRRARGRPEVVDLEQEDWRRVPDPQLERRREPGDHDRNRTS
jgi:UPF0716 protein FxsA